MRTLFTSAKNSSCLANMDFQASKNPRHTENIRQAGIPIRHVMDSCIMRHMGRRVQ